MFRKIVGLMTLAVMLPLAACDDGTDVPAPGTMTLLLTDDPGDFEMAVVVIESIELIGEGEPVMLYEGPMGPTDLLTLANDVEEMVAEAVVPGGTYSQVRFIIPEACIVVEQEGGSFLYYSSHPDFDACDEAPAEVTEEWSEGGTLQLPSYAETGIKVPLPAGAAEVDGDAHVVVLDFQVEQSFGQLAGMSGMWVMNPVILADEFAFTGSLIVELTAPEAVEATLASLGASLGDFEATLGEGEPVAFVGPNEDGAYTAEFRYLIPGVEYHAFVERQDDVPAFEFTLDPDAPQSVTLGSAEQATVPFDVTSASPPPSSD
ncbi:MAG: DUF4382 domain-containing protein [Longimicrobiales bacterium]|nr:DUF4382 domain-containing protein [Longimicrobiales bacterium]